jgi:SAM-dependent methyltransferase
MASTPRPTLPRGTVRDRAWADVRELLELQLEPLGTAAMAALGPRPGEHILDIGCGAGTTAIQLMRAVAPDGTVVGIDTSAFVLAIARETTGARARLRFVEADAQDFPFEPDTFDAAFSRFGVMFFADPIAAFLNIRRSLKPNGRLAFVCWRAFAENLLDLVPFRAAAAHLPPQPAFDAEAPGPFSLADPNRIQDSLAQAGFSDIKITAHDALVDCGDLDSTMAVVSKVGALGKILRESPELRDRVLPAVRSALAAHAGPQGVQLPAATWIVTARAAL